MKVVNPERELFEILNPIMLRELFVSISTFYEIPLKFEYLGKGAEYWEKVEEERLKEKGINYKEKEVWRLAREIFGYEMDGREFVHVVDIGCGTGKPAFLPMRILEKNGIGFDYTAVDISSQMIEIAKENVKEEFGVETRGLVVDLENNALPLSFGWEEPTLFLFLGSTIVNFNWPEIVIERIRRHMLAEDMLAMSTVVIRELNREYINRNLRFYKSEKAEKLTTYIARLLNLPFEFEGRWNPKKRSFENFIKIARDVKLGIGKYKIKLERGKRVRTALSKRFYYDELTAMMHKLRFLTEHVVTTKDREYMLALYMVGRETREGT